MMSSSNGRARSPSARARSPGPHVSCVDPSLTTSLTRTPTPPAFPYTNHASNANAANAGPGRDAGIIQPLPTPRFVRKLQDQLALAKGMEEKSPGSGKPQTLEEWMTLVRKQEEDGNFLEAREMIEYICSLYPHLEQVWLHSVKVHESFSEGVTHDRLDSRLFVALPMRVPAALRHTVISYVLGPSPLEIVNQALKHHPHSISLRREYEHYKFNSLDL